MTVAGVGEVGGYQAVALARQGIGELAIIDPVIFDPPDMNRQYGAMASTIGRHKAEATAEMLRDINPHLRLSVNSRSVTTAEEMHAVIDGSALVIDAIDYAGFAHKQPLHCSVSPRRCLWHAAFRRSIRGTGASPTASSFRATAASPARLPAAAAPTRSGT